MLSHGVLTDGTVRRTGAYVHLAGLHLWVRKKEYERLLVAVGTAPVPTHLASPVRRSGGGSPGAARVRSSRCLTVPQRVLHLQFRPRRRFRHWRRSPRWSLERRNRKRE